MPGGVRTLVMVVLAVVGIGLLARAPVASVPGGSVSESAAPSTPTAPPVPSIPPEDPLVVTAVDPDTLFTRAEDVTTLGVEFATSRGPSPLLLADQLTDGARLRTVIPGTPAEEWQAERIDDVEDVVWFGRSGDTVAWVREDGFIRVRVPGSSGPNRTLSLPAGRRPVDARFLDDQTLAILTASGLREPAAVTVVDVVSHTTVVDTPLGEGPSRAAIGHAWDLEAGLLLVVDATTLHAVDLRRGDVTSRALPVPAARAGNPPLRSVMTVSTAGGLVVVSGVDEIRLPGGRGDTRPRPYGVATMRAYGVAVMDADLQPVAFRDDEETTLAVALDASRVLTAATDGGGALRDRALDVIVALPEDVVVRQVLGEQDVVLVACAGPPCPDSRANVLIALDPVDGQERARRPLGPEFVAYLTDPGLLIGRPAGS